jgi:hypothetical protein
LDAYLEEELYDLVTYCIQNPNASDFESKKHRVQEIGKELHTIKFRIKEEIGKDARLYRSWWNDISKEEWKY